jgi:hypothetical protein
MKKIEFDNICESLGIYPSVALENENVVKAIKAKKSVEEVTEIIKEEI